MLFFGLFLLASLPFASMKMHLFCSNKPNNVLFPFFLFHTVSLAASQSNAHFISSILAGPGKENNVHTRWTTEQLTLNNESAATSDQRLCCSEGLVVATIGQKLVTNIVWI